MASRMRSVVGMPGMGPGAVHCATALPAAHRKAHASHPAPGLSTLQAVATRLAAEQYLPLAVQACGGGAGGWHCRSTADPCISPVLGGVSGRCLPAPCTAATGSKPPGGVRQRRSRPDRQPSLQGERGLWVVQPHRPPTNQQLKRGGRGGVGPQPTANRPLAAAISTCAHRPRCAGRTCTHQQRGLRSRGRPCSGCRTPPGRGRGPPGRLRGEGE